VDDCPNTGDRHKDQTNPNGDIHIHYSPDDVEGQGRDIYIIRHLMPLCPNGIIIWDCVIMTIL
jgi:hypothetical protein